MKNVNGIGMSMGLVWEENFKCLGARSTNGYTPAN